MYEYIVDIILSYAYGVCIACKLRTKHKSGKYEMKKIQIYMGQTATYLPWLMLIIIYTIYTEICTENPKKKKKKKALAV